MPTVTRKRRRLASLLLVVMGGATLSALVVSCAHGGFSIGTVVESLPRGYLSIQFGEEPLYYHDGFFLRPRGGGFLVVGPPVGAVVPRLPRGAQWIQVDGVRHAFYRDVYYRPTNRGRNTFYVVVRLRE